jgi:hypothetical protein
MKYSGVRYKSVYNNLEAELKRRSLTYKDLKVFLGISINALLEKRKGIRQWGNREMILIKSLLDYKGTLDELFEEDGNAMAYNLNMREVIKNKNDDFESLY